MLHQMPDPLLKDITDNRCLLLSQLLITYQLIFSCFVFHFAQGIQVTF